MLKNEKKEVLHFSINTTQVPCCTPYDLTSLYFYKNNISIAKSSNLPFTDSFAVQLICLDHTYLYICIFLLLIIVINQLVMND